MSESCCTRSHLSWGRRRDVGNLIAMRANRHCLPIVCVISIPLLFPRFNSSFKKSSIVLLLMAACCNVDLMICHNDECTSWLANIYTSSKTCTEKITCSLVCGVECCFDGRRRRWGIKGLSDTPSSLMATPYDLGLHLNQMIITEKWL